MVNFNRKLKQSALFTGKPIEDTPPPYAYDYRYNDALTEVETVPSTDITFPSYFCGHVDPVPSMQAPIITTQNYGDSIPLEWGKYRGIAPVEIAKIAPDYIVWCEENLPDGKCTWSTELYERCKELAKTMAANRGRR